MKLSKFCGIFVYSFLFFSFYIFYILYFLFFIFYFLFFQYSNIFFRSSFWNFTDLVFPFNDISASPCSTDSTVIKGNSLILIPVLTSTCKSIYNLWLLFFCATVRSLENSSEDSCLFSEINAFFWILRKCIFNSGLLLHTKYALIAEILTLTERVP